MGDVRVGDVRVDFPGPCGEAWDAMAPRGCDRVCARCDTVVHDLAAYTLDEAEALVRADAACCVRAQIDADGVVLLKRGSGARRMMLVIGVSAGLLAAGEPALASPRHPSGAISGHVGDYGIETRVIATAADGKAYRTRVAQDGSYRIKRLPAGTYRLTFVPSCGERWTAEATVVDGTRSALDTVDPNGCIIVGALRIESDRG